MTGSLQTERLLLRPLSAEDAGPITKWISDLDVARWLTSVPHPYTQADADQFLAKIPAGNDGHLGIRLSDALIGVVTIQEQLGYWLAKPYWGQGFMTEATRAMVKRHFDRGAALLTSGYLIGNAGSARVLAKLGFRATHVIDSHVVSLGRTTANQQMELTRAMWEARL